MPEQTQVGDAPNGMSFMEFARTGHNVFALCLGEQPKFDDPTVNKSAWEQAAIEAIRLMQEAVNSQAPMSARALGQSICEWLHIATQPFDTLPLNVRLSFEAVGRQWVTCFNCEPGGLNIAEWESKAPLWIKSRLENESKPAQASVKPEIPAQPRITEPATNGHAVIATAGPKAAATVTMTGGLQGFRAVVEAMIQEHTRKKTALEALLAKIGPESDEALTEIFTKILKGE